MTMDMVEGPARRLCAYIGEKAMYDEKPLYEALVESARTAGCAGATVLRGVTGFGATSRHAGKRTMRMSQDKPVVGILMGDPAGIGPEVAVKSAVDETVREVCRPLLVGSHAALDRTRSDLWLAARLSRVGTKDAAGASRLEGAEIIVPVADVVDDEVAVSPGKVSKEAGAVVAATIRAAFELAADGRVDALAMAPITKESLSMAEGYPSEFELFEAITDTEDVRAVVKWGNLLRTTVTEHMAFRDIVSRLTPARIVTATEQLVAMMRRLGMEQPRVAVAALNPHGGEGGLFGDEERTVITPAIEALAERGILVRGPVPADTVFVRAMRGEFDGVTFLYHDQGNIAMKTAAFGEGVVIYAGLPLTIVTPGHGSALDIAGRGIANPGNMIEAVKTAAMLAGR